MAKDKSLAICKYIKQILQENDDVTALVPASNISTLSVAEGTEFPYIVIQRNSISVQYTKDIAANNTVYFTVNIVSNNIDDALDIAVEVRAALETFYWHSQENGFRMDPIKLESAYESFDGTEYTEQLDFSCQFNKYN